MTQLETAYLAVSKAARYADTPEVAALLAPVLAVAATPRALHKLDVGIALADGKLRDNLIKELKAKNSRAAQNVEDAAQFALAVVLSKPSGFFESVPALKKYMYDSAKANLYDSRRDVHPAGRKSIRLDLDYGWNTGLAHDSVAWGEDTVTKHEGKHVQRTVVTGPGYESTEARKRRLADAKSRRKEEARRTAPGKAVVLPKNNRGAYTLSDEDLAVWERIKERRAAVPTAPRSPRKHGWATKARS